MVFQKNREKSGFLLMETMVALLVFTISLTILLGAYAQAQNTKRDALLRLEALALARHIINNNFKIEQNQENDEFQSRIEWRPLQTALFDGPDALVATVYVTWRGGKKENQIRLATITVAHG
jgi:Tfp pilus assembly protein PilV